jgi:hypothetical protein
MMIAVLLDHSEVSGMGSPSPLRSVVLTLAVAAVASVASGQNLLVNPEFDTDTSGWDGPGAWDPFDYAGSGSSGSASYTNTTAGASGATFVYQCVTLDPLAGGYDFEVWTYVASGQAPGYVRADLVWYTDAACTDYIEATYFHPSLFDVWAQTAWSDFSPPPALSVRVGVVNQKGAGGTLQTYTDHLWFSLDYSKLFRDGFESGTYDAWDGIVSGL